LKLTPAQFRDAIGISQETLRHWRRVLPIFQGRTGYAPVFTTGDLVAGAIIKTLKDAFGISISDFAEHSVAIGTICDETPWTTLSNGVLVLSLSDKSCVLVNCKTGLRVDQLCLSVPLRPIMDDLTQTMLQDNRQTQQKNLFPLTEVKRPKHQVGTQ